MCALILLHRVIPDFPVVLAANRDERYDRAAAPPELVRERLPYVAPRDLAAGGTWIGSNAAGLTAAVTNRQVGTPDPGRPSRGTLVRQALSYGSAAAARRHLDRDLAGAERNGFNLVYADACDAFLTRGGADVETVRLPPGPHVLTNLHELNALEVFEVDMIAAAAPESTLLETVGALGEFLKRTDAVTADGFAPCKDLGDRGTRSSTIIARADTPHGGLFLHAHGAPSVTAYQDYGHLLRALTQEGA